MKISLTIQRGGMQEFERTGIYPQYLIFHDSETKKRWKQKLRGEKQDGLIRSQGKIIYHYSYNQYGCQMRKVSSGGKLSEPFEVDSVIVEMRD